MKTSEEKKGFLGREYLKASLFKTRILRWNDQESFENGTQERQGEQLESMKITVKGMLIKCGTRGCLAACGALLHISEARWLPSLLTSLRACWVDTETEYWLYFKVMNTWKRQGWLFSWSWTKKERFEQERGIKNSLLRTCHFRDPGGSSQAGAPSHPSS